MCGGRQEIDESEDIDQSRTKRLLRDQDIHIDIRMTSISLACVVVGWLNIKNQWFTANVQTRLKFYMVIDII